MAKFGINDILNAKTKAAGQQAQTDGYKEIYLSPYEVKAAQENTHQKLENIEELADSFLHVGQEQPTVLARVNGEYRIIDGHRRNAANILNLERGHKEYEKVLYRFMDMSEANGIFPKPSDGLQVVAYSGMEIRVNAGYAFINGYAFRNPATLSVTLDTAEGALNRVDRVVVRWDLAQRDMYIAVLKGTPSAKPTATAVTRTTEIWELALADIYVGKGVTRIQTQNITDQRFNSAVCGIVTGTVEEIDASVLTKQFTDFFNTYSAAVLDEFSAYKQSMEKYLTEIAGVYDSYVSKTEGLGAWHK